MSRNEAVSPLRINKTPSASPTKGGGIGRPLSEIGSTEHRRNSPSSTQSKLFLTKESSPFDSSPFNNSPRLFWKEQTTSPKSRFGSENDFDNSSPTLSPKRNSIENLKKASRVKNSSMFAREQQLSYDPASPQELDRPLAAGRPLATSVQGNAYGGSGLNGMRQHGRGDSLTKIPMFNPSKSSPGKLPTLSSFNSPSKDEGRTSPTKSSLASPGRFNSTEYNPDSSMWSEDDSGRQTPRPPLRRHAKSVTFDAAPPTINEYEMVTPDPSLASVSREGSYESDEDDEELSFDQDDSFDASLEDTDKTPVVLPEDWRHMSPDAADTSLTDVYDDVFDGHEGSPMPNARPSSALNMSSPRHGSTASDGESRPLPPLPGMSSPDERRRRDSSIGLSAAAERASGARRRSLPHPPQAAGISKEDLLNMRETSMSLEDRLRLMNFDDDRDTSTPTQEILNQETPTQESHDKKLEGDLGVEVKVAEIDDVTESDTTTVDEPKVPRISRESILRKVKSRNFDEEKNYAYDPESSPDRSYGELADIDPDVPIPSREVSSNFDDHPYDHAPIAESEADSVIDAYSFGETTEMYNEDESEISALEDYERETSVIHHPIKRDSPEEDDDAVSESQYSPEPEEQPTSQSTVDTSGPSTPTAPVFPAADAEKAAQAAQDDSMFAGFNDKENDMDLSLDPLKSSFSTAPSPLDTAPKIGEMREFLRRPETPDQANEESEAEEPGTPDSVIRHPVIISPPEDESDEEISETEATIKGAGQKLRARPSLIPLEIDMAAQRRQVSGEHPPPVPQRSPKRQSLSTDISHVDEGSPSNKENLILDINIGDDSNDLSFGLDKEFDNIIEAQKKGYLMRQNTKVVVASSRQFSDEKPPADIASPDRAAKATNGVRKASADRKAWTTEPWNGKHRRRSIRTASGSRRAPPPSGPIPPMPGQESAAAAAPAPGLGSVAEQDASEDFEDGQERGRLFVKVVGVKDLDLPLPKTERTFFQLTLDNGLHCVTTSWLQLDHSAPIGQEFELVVLDDLEFQLTLQTKLEPPPQTPIAAAPAKVVNHKKSQSAFRNLLSSPKKRKEQERKQKEEADRQAEQEKQEALAKRSRPQTAWDLLHDLVGPDGSFARAYVCLKNHENQAYGRPLNVDIPCFNEWAVDDSGVSSVKSKRGGVVRRPPYRVGKIALQLLYVPKPKHAKDEDMPKSMNACIRELREAEDVKDLTYEGHLSQQGGDCPYWRRRFFRLTGTKLTAYHESTRQPRATINLAKAKKLIDDKSALQQPSSTKSGGRRKSGFAEEEEGYMFVEEGFRIRFANGEVIDFYADSREQKEGWMKVLSETVGKDMSGSRGWTDMVLEKERRDKTRGPGLPQAAQPKPLRENANPNPSPMVRPRSHEGVNTQSAPSSPKKGHSRTRSHAPGPLPPPPIEKDPRHKMAPAPRPREAPRETGKQPGRRDQVRSMIF